MCDKQSLRSIPQKPVHIQFTCYKCGWQSERWVAEDTVSAIKCQKCGSYGFKGNAPPERDYED